MQKRSGRLENKVNKEELKQRLAEEKLKRTTLSFYKYAHIENLIPFREQFYQILSELEVFGRIYVSKEGVNGQMSVPSDKLENLRSALDTIDFLKGIRLNIAIDDDGKSFYKLTIKAKKKILADGLEDETFDVTNRGKHLSAEEFNALAEREDSIIVDMRNHYESEVGHFEGAITPDVETFRSSLPIIEDILQEHKDKHIIMYCTGGIRCEKASAYYKHRGFQQVYQLEGGIIEYARQVKNNDLENKFKGKNFVFDERLGERITEEIISRCHQCGKPCDTHVNCGNEACHILFIQCENCSIENNNCCSSKCKDFIELSTEEQNKLKPTIQFNGTKFGKGRYKAAREADDLEQI
jgi:UPF0176 protein